MSVLNLWDAWRVVLEILVPVIEHFKSAYFASYDILTRRLIVYEMRSPALAESAGLFTSNRLIIHRQRSYASARGLIDTESVIVYQSRKRAMSKVTLCKSQHEGLCLQISQMEPAQAALGTSGRSFWYASFWYASINLWKGEQANLKCLCAPKTAFSMSNMISN